jgi:hypothetical protein
MDMLRCSTALRAVGDAAGERRKKDGRSQDMTDLVVYDLWSRSERAAPRNVVSGRRETAGRRMRLALRGPMLS